MYKICIQSMNSKNLKTIISTRRLGARLSEKKPSKIWKV